MNKGWIIELVDENDKIQYYKDTSLSGNYSVKKKGAKKKIITTNDIFSAHVFTGLVKLHECLDLFANDEESIVDTFKSVSTKILSIHLSDFEGDANDEILLAKQLKAISKLSISEIKALKLENLYLMLKMNDGVIKDHFNEFY